MTILRIIAILGICALLSAQTNEDGNLEDAFGQNTLIISADEHACYFFNIFVAATREQSMRGLMHVRELPDFTGMLFVYREAGVRSMWMKNTYIPLDILFVRGDGSVANIVKDTVPLTLDSISAIEPVNFVLELNAGITEKLGIGTDSHFVFTDME